MTSLAKLLMHIPGIQNHITHWPVWQLAFRSCFLLATVASSLSLIYWLGMLSGWWSLPGNGMSAIVWHLHEMIFGFAATVAIGFSLTAVQTWTGLPSLQGRSVMLLAGLWLLARIGFWLNNPDSLLMATIAQCLWWYCSIYAFTRLLFLSGNRRNYLLIPIFCAMALVNLIVILADFNGFTGMALHLGRTMVLMFTLLIAIIAGRVIPFFTERGIGLIKITKTQTLDRILMSVSCAGIVVFTSGYFYPLPISPAPLLIAAGTLHLVRLVFWFKPGILSRPLLWSLHLSYLFLAVGLIATGLSFLIIQLSLSAALHLITVGAISLMILAMMSRVSLGHTGRPLTPAPWISVAFILLAIAAVIRSALPALGYPLLAWQLSIALWVSSMCLFLRFYSPILFSPKQSN